MFALGLGLELPPSADLGRTLSLTTLSLQLADYNLEPLSYVPYNQIAWNKPISLPLLGHICASCFSREPRFSSIPQA